MIYEPEYVLCISCIILTSLKHHLPPDFLETKLIGEEKHKGTVLPTI